MTDINPNRTTDKGVILTATTSSGSTAVPLGAEDAYRLTLKNSSSSVVFFATGNATSPPVASATGTITQSVMAGFQQTFDKPSSHDQIAIMTTSGTATVYAYAVSGGV